MDLYTKIFLTTGLIWAIIAMLLLLIAWWCAYTKRSLLLHRRLMILLTIAAWLFILGYLLRYLLPGVKPLNIPAYLIPWFAFHALIACIPLFGAPLLLWARIRPNDSISLNLHLNKHHTRYGRILMLLWAFTHAAGALNFFLIY
jgi:uncharacterized membrane protein YozB (DUF420 family)